MSRPYDDERLAAAYDRGNGMPEPSLRAWVELIASFAPRPAPAIVEVGAGTGVFSAAMARWIEGSTVLAVDPSEAMLAQARRHRTHPAVRYAAGSAEAVPAPAGAFDLALLSRVIHHLPDRPRAVAELTRIVRTGGRVVVRTTFRERLDSVVYDHWPLLRKADEQRFPSAADVVADFTAGGFALVETLSFAQPVAADLGAYHDRLVTRPQAKFARLTPEQFRAGLASLAAAARGAGAGPVAERYDVAVFSRP
ncbi:class I SAM-dependent methyltransferase [Streptomyces sp. NPDC004031]